MAKVVVPSWWLTTYSDILRPNRGKRIERGSLHYQASGFEGFRVTGLPGRQTQMGLESTSWFGNMTTRHYMGI